MLYELYHAYDVEEVLLGYMEDHGLKEDDDLYLKLWLWSSRARKRCLNLLSESIIAFLRIERTAQERSETSSMIVWVIAGIMFALFLLLGTRNQTPEWETEEEREEREIEEDLELLLFDEEEEDLL